MSLLHLSLATLGGSFVAIPIVLHLLMKRQPKPLQFPALRFVRARQESNQRKLRLRQMALLALRCAAIACLAFALARPRVPTAAIGNWGVFIGLLAGSAIAGAICVFGWTRANVGRSITAGLGLFSLALLLLACSLFYRMRQTPTATLLENSEAPVAAALVFDVSPRMGYRHQNESRLDKARELGEWVLQQLAFDSDVAVLDNASITSSFSVDIPMAKKSVEGLQTTPNSRDLLRTIKAAAELLRTSDQSRKEIYVFTDMTASSWASTADQAWLEELAVEPPVMVYMLDVGVPQPTNLRLTNVDLLSAHLAGEQPLELSFEVTAEGPGGNVEVEVLLENQDSQLPIIVDGKPELPELVLRGQQQLDVPKNGTASGRFVLNGIGDGTHHGVIRTTQSDGLLIDDSRYFTCAVTSTRSILIAAGDGAESSLLTDVLGPEGNAAAAQSLFHCYLTTPEQLISAGLENHQAVALLDPPPLSVGTWQRLANFVREGGGLAIFLGRNAVPVDQFNSAAAQELLPGRLSRQWRAGSQDIYLSLSATDHRIIRGLKSRATTVPWNDFPVFRHWGFDDTRGDAVSVIRFGNGQPAMMETMLGSGRTLTMTTPISDALNVAGRPAWNLLPTAPNAWPYFVLTFDAFRYLSQSGATRLNYDVGEPAAIAHDFDSSVKLFSPGGIWEEVGSSQSTVAIPFTSAPGHYRLKSAKAGQAHTGCSVNLADEATSMRRITESELKTLWGETPIRIARNRDEVDREIGEARMGREFFPWLMLAVAVTLAMEHVMANRFYAGPDQPLTKAGSEATPA